MIDKFQDRLLGPPFPVRALGRCNDKGELGSLADALRRSVDTDFLQVITTLTGPVKEDNKRPFFLRVRFVVFREGEQVFEFLRRRDLFDKDLLGKPRAGRGEWEQRESCG